jgi:rhodanese-related sulfurtransferase
MMSTASPNASTAPATFPQSRSAARASIYIRDLAGVILLFVLAMIAGIVANRFSAQPIALLYQSPEQRLAGDVKLTAELTNLVNAPPFQASDLQTIELAEFHTTVDGKSALILDARSAPFYALGHVPGALNLARDDFAHDYQVLAKKLATYRDQPVVVYCSGGECHDSKLVASALLSLGFTNVKVFTGGWEEWSQANLPAVKGAMP